MTAASDLIAHGIADPKVNTRTFGETYSQAVARESLKWTTAKNLAFVLSRTLRTLRDHGFLRHDQDAPVAEWTPPLFFLRAATHVE